MFVPRFLRAILLLLALSLAPAAHAATLFSLRTGNDTTKTQSMPIDSNKCATAGPRAMYVGGVITNNGAATVTNVTAALSGLGSGFFLAGGQAATQTVGSLGAGQSTGVYWFVGYGCTVGATATPAISITSVGTTSNTTNLTLIGRSAISANAGGNVLSSQLGPGAVVGQTIYFDASYDFGGSSTGDEFFFQPSGSQAFNAACFRLVGTEIRNSNIGVVVTGTKDRLYFVQSNAQPGNGYFADVRYLFEYQCAGSSTVARPYAVQTSGGDNIKYTGNFDGSGSISISFPGATNPFTITKVADKTSGITGVSATVKYTVTVTNPSLFASRISSFVDTLPAGATYIGLDAASDITAANSSSVPSALASGTITFTGIQDLSYPIAAGGTVKLIYSVLMPATAGTYTNSARAQFGTATTPTVTASFNVVAAQPLTMSKTSAVTSDPVNGTTNPKQIPGARTAYTVTVTNPNPAASTVDSILVIDPTPSGLSLYVSNYPSATGPVRFQEGAVPSTLNYSFTSLASTTDDIDFSKDNGATWAYVPAPDSLGLDSAVTHIRVKPRGAMASASSFSLQFAYGVK